MALNESVILVQAEFITVIFRFQGTPVPHITGVRRGERELTVLFRVGCNNICKYVEFIRNISYKSEIHQLKR